ncbi:MAG: hypothetical protein WCI55_17235, partial [Armatimonadota bacterium]
QQRKGGGSVQFDIDERLAKSIDLSEFVQEIELKCWDKLAKLSWRPFEEAREFARKLTLRNLKEWTEFCKGYLPKKGSLPSDIPAYPNQTYEEKGWFGVGDWLGTGNVAPQNRQFLTFQEARAFVHQLDLKCQRQWKNYCQGKMPDKGILPPDIPSNPNKTFANTGWIGLGDWLGTGTIAPMRRKFRTFQRARSFSRSLGLKSQSEWNAYCKGTIPSDIPKNPQGTYAGKGWIGYGDWLGTGNIADQFRQFIPFTKARAFVRGLTLKNVSEWRAFCRGNLSEKGNLPSDIPAAPMRTYAGKGWKGMGDWLGSGNIAPTQRKFRSFKDARTFARSLGLKRQSEWFEFRKGSLYEKGILPADVPAAPEGTYANKGWAGYGDWLGTGKVANQDLKFRSFLKARAFARSLRIKNGREWRKYCAGKMRDKGTRPQSIPSNPNLTYAGAGWSGMSDWLGTGRTRVSKSSKPKSSHPGTPPPFLKSTVSGPMCPP